MSSEKIKWYAEDIDTIKTRLDVGDEGLTTSQAHTKLKEFVGQISLKTRKKRLP